jgi:hypothetical protein
VKVAPKKKTAGPEAFLAGEHTDPLESKIGSEAEIYIPSEWLDIMIHFRSRQFYRIRFLHHLTNH